MRDKAFNIAKNPKYDGYQRRHASTVYTFFDRKTSASATHANKFVAGAFKNENMSNQELAEELHKPIIRKFKKKKVQSPFIDNIWGAVKGNTHDLFLSKIKKRYYNY